MRAVAWSCVAGAPRPTKMGTIVSPWRYDAVARHSPQSANLRRPAILHCAPQLAVLPISPVGRYPSMALTPFDLPEPALRNALRNSRAPPRDIFQGIERSRRRPAHVRCRGPLQVGLRKCLPLGV